MKNFKSKFELPSNIVSFKLATSTCSAEHVGHKKVTFVIEREGFPDTEVHIDTSEINDIYYSEEILFDTPLKSGEVFYVTPIVENNKPNFYIKECWPTGAMFDCWSGRVSPRYYSMSFIKDDTKAPGVEYSSYAEMVLVAESYLYNLKQTNIEDVNIILNGKLLSTEEFKNGGKK